VSTIISLLSSAVLQYIFLGCLGFSTLGFYLPLSSKPTPSEPTSSPGTSCSQFIWLCLPATSLHVCQLSVS